MHHWNRMSSGSIFSPEYPRALVILFNWAIGAVLLAAPMQAIPRPPVARVHGLAGPRLGGV
jgi:hypothetical protein